MNEVNMARKYLAKCDNAKARGIKFDMSFTAFKNIMRAKYCFYTGVELTDDPNSPAQRTIDRINHTKGYEKGNVVACSNAFNSFKSTLEKNGFILNPNMRKSITRMFDAVDESMGLKKPKSKCKPKQAK